MIAAIATFLNIYSIAASLQLTATGSTWSKISFIVHSNTSVIEYEFQYISLSTLILVNYSTYTSILVLFSINIFHCPEDPGNAKGG